MPVDSGIKLVVAAIATRLKKHKPSFQRAFSLKANTVMSSENAWTWLQWQFNNSVGSFGSTNELGNNNAADVTCSANILVHVDLIIGVSTGSSSTDVELCLNGTTWSKVSLGVTNNWDTVSLASTVIMSAGDTLAVRARSGSTTTTLQLDSCRFEVTKISPRD